LTERVDLDGLAVTLVDTAGLREAGDAIEAEGVRRAREAQEAARLVLMIADGSAPLTVEDRSWMGASTQRRVVVISKADLPAAAWVDEAGPEPVRVSVRTGAGLGELRRRIVTALTGEEPTTDTPTMSNVRHLALVDQARGSVARARMALAEGATEELVLAELGTAREALESIVGRRTPDDLLRHIFGRFCIGK
jgi:tRNA modification GTPase